VTERARREYAAVMQRRYEGATRGERSKILDEYCEVTGCHRKAAIRRLGAGPSAPARRPGRPRRYGRELQPLLERVWQASQYLSGKLLQPIVPTLLEALQRQSGGAGVVPEQAARLTAASAATLDRLLKPLRRRRPMVPRRPAPAATSVRAQVPVRTWSQWRRVPLGALQGDLVLHCGETTAGLYCATLVAVDVATTWTEMQAIWGLHQQRVTGGIEAIRRRLPFPLASWHSDNGSEFINACLLGWCQRHQVQFTRGRPYRKNDQAWVEQRNGLLIRGIVGYDRYSSRPALAVLQRLYELLRLHHNFFRPVRKLISKERVGGTVRKRYDAAQTPYQRILATDRLTPEARQALRQQLQTLDPVVLAQEIQRTLDTLWTLADTRVRPRPAVAHG